MQNDQYHFFNNHSKKHVIHRLAITILTISPLNNINLIAKIFGQSV